jgi:hypothetical protein
MKGVFFSILINALSGGILNLTQLLQSAINSRDINLATGNELDLFGEQINTPRLQDESDDDYRERAY